MGHPKFKVKGRATRPVFMRLTQFVVIAILVPMLAGYMYLRRMGLDTKGTTISQAITLASVRKNMIRIADAEREQTLAFSKCYSIEQMISMGKIDANQQDRGGYSFSISCQEGGTDFTVTATHAPAPPDSPLRWPVLVVDQTLTIRETY
jgi:hypothetical protein